MWEWASGRELFFLLLQSSSIFLSLVRYRRYSMYMTTSTRGLWSSLDDAFFSGCFLLVDLNDYNIHIHIFAEMSLTFNRKKNCWIQIYTHYSIIWARVLGYRVHYAKHHVCGHSKRWGFFPPPLLQINVESAAAAVVAAVVVVVIFAWAQVISQPFLTFVCRLFIHFV